MPAHNRCSCCRVSYLIQREPEAGDGFGGSASEVIVPCRWMSSRTPFCNETEAQIRKPLTTRFYEFFESWDVNPFFHQHAMKPVSLIKIWLFDLRKSRIPQLFC